MRKQWKPVTNFLFWGSRITADSDCSHQIKRHLLLGRKAMANLGSILKSRDNTLPTKVCLVKAMVFPVVTYGCESWTIKKTEDWKIVVLEKTLESPLDGKEIHPVNPKGYQSQVHWKDWCWSWNSSTLTTWCKELNHLKRPWCCERLKVGEEGDHKGWDGWMASRTQWACVWVNSGSWWWTGRPGVLRFMGSKRVGHDWATDLIWYSFLDYFPL